MIDLYQSSSSLLGCLISVPFDSRLFVHVYFLSIILWTQVSFFKSKMAVKCSPGNRLRDLLSSPRNKRLKGILKRTPWSNFDGYMLAIQYGVSSPGHCEALIALWNYESRVREVAQHGAHNTWLSPGYKNYYFHWLQTHMMDLVPVYSQWQIQKFPAEKYQNSTVLN